MLARWCKAHSADSLESRQPACAPSSFTRCASSALSTHQAMQHCALRSAPICCRRQPAPTGSRFLLPLPAANTALHKAVLALACLCVHPSASGSGVSLPVRSAESELQIQMQSKCLRLALYEARDFCTTQLRSWTKQH